jgi:CheY-like chemotaxis protein
MKKNKTIFLIDDDKDDQQFFLTSLSEIDQTIQCNLANNGKDALDKLNNSSTTPDLIFIDINMPLMNGFECLTELRKQDRFNKTPIVILTTSKADAEAQCARVLGANVFLTKPSSVRVLQTKLQHVLSSFLANKKTANHDFFVE